MSGRCSNFARSRPYAGKEKEAQRRQWEARNVELIPKWIGQEQEELLLTELAQIFYDEFCQLRKQSRAVAETPLAGLKIRRSENE